MVRYNQRPCSGDEGGQHGIVDSPRNGIQNCMASIELNEDVFFRGQRGREGKVAVWNSGASKSEGHQPLEMTKAWVRVRLRSTLGKPRQSTPTRTMHASAAEAPQDILDAARLLVCASGYASASCIHAACPHSHSCTCSAMVARLSGWQRARARARAGVWRVAGCQARHGSPSDVLPITILVE